MKSRRCTRCNVSSVRYGWGFALLARDGWAVRDAEPLALSDGGWLCPACSAHCGQPLPGPGRSPAPPAIGRGWRPRGALRILLIDDEDMVRRCTARALSDFEVVSASSGGQALDLLAKDNDFDAVLSDVMMPRMTGPQLYARCCLSHPALAQRFVFASGNPETARTELMQVVAKTGGGHTPTLLAKPSQREALLLALYAAAAHAELHSGTYAVADTVETELKNQRG